MCLAVPGEVLTIDEGDEFTRQGQVSFGGVVKPVNLAFVPEASVGDHVLVHSGFAIAMIDAAQAARTLELLDRLEPEERACEP